MGHRFLGSGERREGWEILRFYGGVGAGHTRETERIREKMQHCKRSEHGYQEREGTVYQNMTERQRKQKETRID